MELMSAPEPGTKAPDFDLPTDGGGQVSLAGLKGKAVVLYFYPKDDTSGCTAEAQAFTAEAGEFEKAGRGGGRGLQGLRSSATPASAPSMI